MKVTLEQREALFHHLEDVCSTQIAEVIIKGYGLDELDSKPLNDSVLGETIELGYRGVNTLRKVGMQALWFMYSDFFCRR